MGGKPAGGRRRVSHPPICGRNRRQKHVRITSEINGEDNQQRPLVLRLVSDRKRCSAWPCWSRLIRNEFASQNLSCGYRFVPNSESETRGCAALRSSKSNHRPTPDSLDDLRSTGLGGDKRSNSPPPRIRFEGITVLVPLGFRVHEVVSLQHESGSCVRPRVDTNDTTSVDGRIVNDTWACDIR